jgi:hypothetical protein
MAVVGSGTIGPDIAYGFRVAFPQMKLYLVDVVEEPLKKAQARFEGYAKKGVERKTIRPEQVEAILGGIVYTTDYSQLKNCELVIEAATENLELKKKICGIVHKKRAVMTLREAEDFIQTGRYPGLPKGNEQVINELSYFMSRYKVIPAVYLSYKRIA